MEGTPKQEKIAVESLLLQLDKPYRIKASKKEGELVLSKLARESTREYAWIFDEEDEIWFHHPSTEFNLDVSVGKGQIRNSITPPAEYSMPISNSSVDYHIHPTQPIYQLLENDGVDPDGWATETMLVKNQTPSVEDLQNCAIRYGRGFKSSKIVTPYGVTTIQFHPEQLHGAKNIKISVTVPRELTIKALQDSSNNIVYVTRIQLAEIEKQLNGLFTLSFEAI